MVSNHVKDLIDRYGTDGSVVPQALTDYVQAREFYDYNDHSRVGAAHGEFVTDEICDRFSVLGNVEQATTKLRELESIGVDQYSIYLMTHGQEETLAAYGEQSSRGSLGHRHERRPRSRGQLAGGCAGLGTARAGLARLPQRHRAPGRAARPRPGRDGAGARRRARRGRPARRRAGRPRGPSPDQRPVGGNGRGCRAARARDSTTSHSRSIDAQEMPLESESSTAPSSR